MAVSKQKKVEILDELRAIFNQKSVLLLTTNQVKQTINAENNYIYRSELNAQHVEVRVAKNTLIQIALKEKGIEVNDLYGQTYIQAIRDGDEVQVIKTVMDTMKVKFADNFNVYGSVVNGEFMDAAQTVQLSKVNSLEQSMSQIAGNIQQIIAKIAIGVKEVPTGLARGVHAMATKES